MTNTRRARAAAFLAQAVLGALLLAGCGGGEDFENRPRPPVTLEVTGVISESRVTISPDSFGAGPVVITISNQTDDSHTITLEGGDISPEEVGPVNPQDTVTIQKTLPAGTYTVSANSGDDVLGAIEPARIKVGAPRDSASDDLELP